MGTTAFEITEGPADPLPLANGVGTKVKEGLKSDSKSMLFLNHQSDSCLLGIILQPRLSVTLIWRYCNQGRF